MHYIDIMRGTTKVDTVAPEAASVQTRTIMGEDTLTLVFILNHWAKFHTGDWCEAFGMRYHLNTVPIVTKTGDNRYAYTLKFDAEGHDLKKVQYLQLDQVNELNESDFILTGTAADFMALLMQNVGRFLSGYTLGEVLPTDYKTLSFSRENCLSVLARLATEFETEFWIVGKTIHLTKRSQDTGYSFQVGRYKGAYEVTQKDQNGATVVTRLYVYGSDKNLPANYRGYITPGRLRLPGTLNPCLISNVTVQVLKGLLGWTFKFYFAPPISPTATGLTIEYRRAGSSDDWEGQTGPLTSPFTLITLSKGPREFRFRTEGGTCALQTTPVITVEDTVTVPMLVQEAMSYIERNVEKYGLIEDTMIFDDVFPHRTGTVTSVNALDPFEFVDSSMDFDVNTHLQPGLEAKVHVKSGQLAGYTLKIASYDHTSKKFRILKVEEERNQEVPSQTMRLAIGDEYTLIDIRMPQIYIEKAEAELLEKARAVLQVNSEEQVSFSINIDPEHIKTKKWTLAIGQEVWLKDTAMHIQRKIRVVKTVRGVVEEYKYNIDVSDTVSPSQYARILAATAENTRGITALDRQLVRNALLNGEVVGTLKMKTLPTTNTTDGFSFVVIHNDTGELYRLV